uniref:Neur_chan_memb domain-containing protein n=1 Tax=Panagrellus redivivus TaxID=6233 RepID=A0A7E4VJ56_PANRE
MYIEGMTSFRAQSNDFSIDIYFQEHWIDKRLAHNGTKRILIKDRASFDQIWHPDIYFANARTADFHECGCILMALYFMTVDAYDVEQIILKWKDTAAIDINAEIKMPDMRLRKLEVASRNDSYATGIWSCALVHFRIDRELMHHIIQTYIPSGLIVTISFFSFWLDVEAVPGRVSLCITTILTVATQNSAAKMALPQASDLKAIDVWMGVCLTFVFSTMIEFTVVNFCVRRKPRNRTKEAVSMGLGEQVQRLIYANQRMADTESPLHQRNTNCRSVLFEDEENGFIGTKQNGDLNHSTDSVIFADQASLKMSTPPKLFRRFTGNGPKNESPKPMSLLNGTTEEWKRGQRLTRTKKKAEERMLRAEENRRLAQNIDRYARWLFPLVFVLFNVMYWGFYLGTTPSEL